MTTIYNIERLAQGYRAAHNRSTYAAAHMDVVARHLAKRLDPGKPVAVLDVGCGAGGTYQLLIDRLPTAAGTLRYVGVDDARRQIELARLDHANARFVNASAAALPFHNEAFDAVFECRLFQFVSDPIGVLREMMRTSRDLVIAAIYTYEETLACFHPMFDRLQTDQNCRVTAIGDILRDLNIQKWVDTLVFREDRPNHYKYAFAKQRRTLIAHAALDDFLDGADVRVLDRRVETKALETIFAPENGVTGVTTENDRLAFPFVRQQTLVLARRG
jgi:ubiquinone/menaquinone biosynthesis C-methylase UbiE